MAAATLGPWLVLVLLACGAVELGRATAGAAGAAAPAFAPVPPLAALAIGGGGLLALAWVAFKVGALSYGGGFVIIPLMQGDAVDHYHWMTDAQFLNAVALGQVTPGPVVHTVAVVGYAAAGIGGGLLAAAVAFAPSFAFVLLGADRFDRLRADRGRAPSSTAPGPPRSARSSARPSRSRSRSPSRGSSPSSRGAAVALLVLRRGVVLTLLLRRGGGGVVVALAGGPLPA